MINKFLFIVLMVSLMSFGLVTMASASNYGFLLDEYGQPTQAYLDSQTIEDGDAAAAKDKVETHEKFKVRCSTDYEVASRSTLKAEACWDLLGS